MFTGGGSEADNLALKGVIDATDGDHGVTTTVEHSAVVETCDWLAANAVDVRRVSTGSEGRVDPNGVQDAIPPDTVILSGRAALYVISTAIAAWESASERGQ